jgi:hypothetical protein
MSFGKTAARTPIGVDPGFEAEAPAADFRATECAINLVRTDSLFPSAMSCRLRPLGLTPAGFNALST